MIRNLSAVLILTAMTTFVWSLISGVLMGAAGFAQAQAADPASAVGSMLGVFAMCGANAILVLWYTKRSCYSGRLLFRNIFILVFGIMSFMTQIETLYFNNSIKMPLLMIAIVVLTGAISAAVYAWYAVRLKRKSALESELAGGKVKEDALLGRLTIMAVVYVVFYFSFGYYIAWQFPAVREYYSGSTAIVPFWTHMINQVKQDAGLIIFQVLRGYLWAGIGYLLLGGLKVDTILEKVLLMGLLLSIPLATPLFAPNEFMPSAVRFGHFFELLIENFIFGALMVLIFKEKIQLKNKRTAKYVKA